MNLENLTEKIDKIKILKYGFSLTVIFIFIPWFIIYIFTKTANILYQGFLYSAIGIVITLLGYFIYKKNKSIVLIFLILVFIIILYQTLKNLFLFTFFVELGSWSLG